jgi:Kef-type K+ transport system membrane component KefB
VLFPAPVIGALQVLAQLGLILFMFLVGLELDLRLLRGQSGRVALIAQASIVVPVALGLPLAWFLYPSLGDGVDRGTFGLFIAAALGITAFPVLARLLRETGLQGSRAGSISLLCAALNDIVAWGLLALVVAMVDAGGPAGVLRMLGLTVCLLAVTLLVLRPILARLPDLPLWSVLLIALACALTSQAIGGHVVLGAFLAGVLMPDRPQWRRAVRARLDGVVSVLLLPIFFAMVGLSTRVDELTSPAIWAVVLLVIAVATVGKFAGSTLVARLTGETRRDSVTIGVLMNTRGLTEVVFLSVGLQLHIITPRLFTVMVLMAVVTTMMAAPALQVIGRRGEAEPDQDEGRQADPASRSAAAV